MIKQKYGFLIFLKSLVISFNSFRLGLYTIYWFVVALIITESNWPIIEQIVNLVSVWSDFYRNILTLNKIK